MNSFPISRDEPVSHSISKIVLSTESKDVLQRLKKINHSYFFWQDPVLVNKLKIIDRIELANVLNYFLPR